MNNIKKKLLSLWNEYPKRFEWIIIGAIFVVYYVMFCHNDIATTGNRSFLMYSHFWKFYEASFYWAGDLGANYLPSTFWLFAIWDLPLKLLGLMPESIRSAEFANIMWYKLLPVLVYFATAILMEKVVLEMGMGEKKAKIAKFAFIVSPIAIFSQFIFSQYDIFTVFFILLGMLYYLRDDWKKFVLFFGIAATFKYHALIYFIVLMLLKEKKVLAILKQLVCGLLPIIIEVLLYIRDPFFVQSVFGFGALNNAKAGVYIGYYGTTNLILIACLILFMWAYVVNVTTKQDMTKWAVYFGSGVSFVMFGLCQWHPQWLVMIVPFFIFSVLVNENGKIFILLKNVFVIAFYVLTACYYVNNVDQEMLYNGIMRYVLDGREFSVTMSNIYRFTDISMLSSCLCGLLLIFFLFNHPKYHISELNELKEDIVGNFKLLYVVGVLTYILPTALCMYHVLFTESMMYNNTQTKEICGVLLSEDTVVQQHFIADTDELYRTVLQVGTNGQVIGGQLTIQLKHAKTGEILAENSVDASIFVQDGGYYTVLDEKIRLNKGDLYLLEISGTGESEQYLSVYMSTNYNIKNKQEMLSINDVDSAQKLNLQIYGN